MVVGESAGVLHTPPLISRLLVQTGRQSGLSVVYTDLLSFSGDEIYIQPEPSLAGKTFREALFAYEDSAVLGVSTAEGKNLMPPPFDRVMQASDQIIAISQDDDTVVPNGKPTAIDAALLAPAPATTTAAAERTLVLGDSERLELVLRELDAYVAPGSTTLVVGEEADTSARLAEAAAFKNMAVSSLTADITDRTVLDGLDVPSFDHVLVLAETAGRSQEMADARTMITLLHLRDLLRKAGSSVPVTTEMLEGESRELAAVAEADDFIVSNALVSLVVCQVSENKRLAKVFEELLSPEGYEIYLKPAGEYVVPGAEVDFYTVVEAALRRGHVALGYRVAARSRDAAASYGVRLNPKKRERVRFAAEDRIVVLAEK
jgi:voltage-gated potassium channel Kch